jgi:hypothetical protein
MSEWMGVCVCVSMMNEWIVGWANGRMDELVSD